ncbi:hypothetical protein [Deinococcus ruber]|uniref:Uncharacterized protein n=1 Tax=Deinococcus ruber TaxID=1848197 RepID=A0A918CAT4_9DEIO|nr:hypothetical protein [Deinococcus ruber]GGR15869.1 hypothetical protein GCM10008957_30760 [Deinococcus ruber]
MSLLPQELRPLVQRIYPTAARVILHARRTPHPLTHLLEDQDDCAAFDHQGRLLFPLRPEEMDRLRDTLRHRCGGGLLVLDLSAYCGKEASAVT